MISFVLSLLSVIKLETASPLTAFALELSIWLYLTGTENCFDVFPIEIVGVIVDVSLTISLFTAT